MFLTALYKNNLCSFLSLIDISKDIMLIILILVDKWMKPIEMDP